ncbi:COBW domain-containing protein 1 [Phalaenopsis equestris]|uniref:COBW domain-containing protein 1 n=1 Tax=Phalaenopsis equestris TaxID=78828 RepID=UPI0009E1FAFB|nr:COBW domain-containing protein 1 [Phalaenopsis equestris]
MIEGKFFKRLETLVYLRCLKEDEALNVLRRIDHILLETTGLADPAPLASVLWLDDQLESAVRLDSIITVVDAKNIQLQLKEYSDSASFPEAFFQIAFADVVILNKIDLILQENRCGDSITESLEDIEKRIHSINSLATILQTVRCQVDLHEILDRKAYGANHLAHLEALLEDSKTAPVGSRHDYSVRTFCIFEELPVDLDKVRLWLEDLLWEKKSHMDVYRCKGILNIHGSDQLHTLQAVREIYEVVPARRWLETEQKTSKIVFIGRHLDETVLRNSFRSCIL